jgi:hypothetical protein
MKRILLFAALFIICSCTFISCEDTCKTCRQVTYINNVYDHEGSLAEYCGTDLLAIEAMDDVVIGNTRTAWECD